MLNSSRLLEITLLQAQARRDALLATLEAFQANPDDESLAKDLVEAVERAAEATRQIQGWLFADASTSH
jgi:hypothetical protein